MCGEPVDDRIGLHREFDGLPRLARIFGTLDRAGNAWYSVPIAHKDDVGVIGLEHDAPAIRAVIGGIELGEIMVVPVLPLVRAGGDAKGRSGIDGRLLARTQGHAVNIAMEGVGPEGRQMEPAVTAIATLVHPIHLDAGPYDAMVSRVDDHVGGTRDANRA